MINRSLKESLTGRRNDPVASNAVTGDSDENVSVFAANRREVDFPDESSDVRLKEGKALKTVTDGKKHDHDVVSVPPELRSILASRQSTASKIRSISTSRSASKSEINAASRTRRSISATRSSSISVSSTPAFPTVRSSQTTKKTSSSSVSSLTRSPAPSTRKTSSRSSTPSNSHSRPTIPKPRSAPNSRSSTPIPTSGSRSQATERTTSGTRVLSSGRTSISRQGIPSYNYSPPQTPPRLKATTSSSPRLHSIVSTKGTTSKTSNFITRDSQKSCLGVIGTTYRKSSPADSSGTKRASISKASLEMAIKHMDITNGRAGRRTFSNSTTLYPRSKNKASLSSSSSTSSSKAVSPQKAERLNRKEKGEEEGRVVGKGDEWDSRRYDALLFVEDEKDTNWLLSLDDLSSSDSDHTCLFDPQFESPPEPPFPL